MDEKNEEKRTESSRTQDLVFRRIVDSAPTNGCWNRIEKEGLVDRMKETDGGGHSSKQDDDVEEFLWIQWKHF